MMKITLIGTALIAASFAAGLTGCAGVSTDVRASPSAAPLQGERSYVLARSPLQDDTPDHREYETLIRTELGKYGFADAFNPGTGWVSTDTLGLDVGITLLSAENLRQGSIWNWFMANPEPQRAMRLAGIDSPSG